MKNECAQYTKLVPVSAEEAAEWLTQSKGNRTLKSIHIDYLMRQIEEDCWTPVEAIVFDVDGVLVDGHHRLTAQVKTGRTLIHNVTRNAPRNARSVLDTGLSRSTSDVMSLHGESNTARRSAVIRTLIYVLTGKVRKISPQDVKRIEPLLAGGCEFAGSLRGRKFPATLSCALAFAFQLNPEKIMQLVTSIKEETTLENTPGAAIRVLLGTPKKGESVTELTRKFMRGVGAHLKDEKLSCLKDGSGLRDLVTMRRAAGLPEVK